jgi:hypothetical protein
VLEGILKPFPDADLDVLVVWIAMMRGDTHEAARKAAAKFNDKRVRQFFDPRRAAGEAIARSFGCEDCVAWDFYLFYPDQSAWADLPPQPEAFMHQLPNSWADRNCLFEKNRLTEKLTETMQSLFP